MELKDLVRLYYELKEWEANQSPYSPSHLVKGLRTNGGWKVVEMQLIERYISLIGKMRKAKRDNAFYEYKGSLKELDYLFNIISEISAKKI